MYTPILSIHIEKLRNNLAVILGLCEQNNIQLTPITKVVMGDPVICKMYTERVTSLGDSRLRDIVRMKNNAIEAEFMLIRTPSLKNVAPVVEICDSTLNTELKVLEAMNEYCLEKKITHKAICMIEMGDLREGIMPQDFQDFLKQCRHFRGLEIVGIGANATCFAGLIPTPDNLSVLEKAAKDFVSIMGHKPLYISGGGSNVIPLLENQTLPPYINHLRVGESIVMGVDAIYKKPVQGCFQDCFTLTGEIIELKTKPSIPLQPLTKNAFGETPIFKDKGLRKRAIVDIGRLDTDVSEIEPLDLGITILGASSDHLIVDVEEAEQSFQVGDRISFGLHYSALLYSMSSDYVQKKYIS
ncbi:MAG: alanine/ornithine racemase family PLP-dependent enzyme [Caldisericia bacterium]|nr:alanine/ornithine racemase family PLP-dependent enzyme [Caldisericia bacterium]